FARIPEYLDEFDGVTSVDKYNGKVEIHLYKELDDGYVRILTVSSKERNSLIVSKLVGVSKEKFEAKYSKKIERNAGSPRGQDASIPSTKARLTASVLSDTIISQTPPNVNTPKSLSPLGDDFPIRSDLRGTPASELKYEDFEAEKKNLNKKLYEIRSARRETSAQYREAIFTLQAAFPKIRDGCFYKCVKL
ncbi:MAG: hypothetical protein IJF48_03375, partial [Clostridia bacterium]|nr:hypothetical protein [Clostridia bacterium]